jgi:molybdopterin-guanine dinucleotide biosynthesis protein A
MGVPVWPDAQPDHPGPLAGFLAGLTHCETSWLVTVPCDTPHFPLDYVARMAHAADESGALVAMAATHEPDPADGQLRTQVQPVFSLVHTSLLESLLTFTASGGRKIDAWTALHPCVTVPFEDASAFRNANTLAELRQLQVAPPLA